MPVRFISAEMTGVAVGLVIYFLGASWQVAVAGGVIGAAVGYWIGRTVLESKHGLPANATFDDLGDALAKKKYPEALKASDADAIGMAIMQPR